MISNKCRQFDIFTITTDMTVTVSLCQICQQQQHTTLNKKTAQSAVKNIPNEN